MLVCGVGACLLCLVDKCLCECVLCCVFEIVCCFVVLWFDVVGLVMIALRLLL